MLEGKPGSLEWISSGWATSLETLPTVLQRLELLSSLRDLHTGRYVHHGMSLSAGSHTHALLLASHRGIFAHWQAMSMREQMRDLKAFLRTVSLAPDVCGERITRKEKQRLILETWTDLESYRNFVPQSVSTLDKELFLVNLATMIAVLKQQFAAQRRTGPATGT